MLNQALKSYFLNCKFKEKTYKIDFCEEDEELLRNRNSFKRMLNLCKRELLCHTSLNFYITLTIFICNYSEIPYAYP